jgi:hypothetical protein
MKTESLIALAFKIGVTQEPSRLEPLLREHSSDYTFNTAAGETVPLGVGLTVGQHVRLAQFPLRHSLLLEDTEQDMLTPRLSEG